MVWMEINIVWLVGYKHKPSKIWLKIIENICCFILTIVSQSARALFSLSCMSGAKLQLKKDSLTVLETKRLHG